MDSNENGHNVPIVQELKVTPYVPPSFPELYELCLIFIRVLLAAEENL